jgi:hypothetical protein
LLSREVQALPFFTMSANGKALVQYLIDSRFMPMWLERAGIANEAPRPDGAGRTSPDDGALTAAAIHAAAPLSMARRRGFGVLRFGVVTRSLSPCAHACDRGGTIVT